MPSGQANACPMLNKAEMIRSGTGRTRYSLMEISIAALGCAAVFPLAPQMAYASESLASRSSDKTVVEFLHSDLITIVPSAMRKTVAFSGTLIALNTALVKVKVAGELLNVEVRQGQVVRSGQVVARIDPTDVQARVNARTADVEVAKAQLALAEKNRDTQQVLLEKNFISKNAFDSTQSGYDVALARLRLAEAELVSARKALGDSVLVAPISGVVADRFAEPGERVPIDARVISIVDLSRLEIEASVPAEAIGLVRVGQGVEFRVDGFGERRFQGKVSRISPATAPGSRSISIYVALENPGNALRAGLFVQGELLVSRAENVLSAPAAAIRDEGGKSYVYVVTGDLLKRRSVEVVREGPDAPVRIVSGLTPGERIVRGNLGSLRDGAAVRIRGSVSKQP